MGRSVRSTIAQLFCSKIDALDLIQSLFRSTSMAKSRIERKTKAVACVQKKPACAHASFAKKKPAAGLSSAKKKPAASSSAVKKKPPSSSSSVNKETLQAVEMQFPSWLNANDPNVLPSSFSFAVARHFNMRGLLINGLHVQSLLEEAEDYLSKLVRPGASADTDHLLKYMADQFAHSFGHIHCDWLCDLRFVYRCCFEKELHRSLAKGASVAC